MKIVFFDTRDEEKTYYTEHCSDILQQVYSSEPITKCNFLNYDFSGVSYLSATVTSDLSKDVLLRFPNLKFIFTRSVGFNHIDLNYCKKKCIKVFNAPHYGDWAVAEFAFALLLNLAKKINFGIEKMKNPGLNFNLVGFELHNKILGIIGLGAIGERISDIAKGFGMKVFAYDKQYKENYKYLPLDKLLSVSDVISINCPLNSDTKYLLDDKMFSKIKRGAVIINVARGEIIDTNALISSLESGQVGYAGLDVTECENMICMLSDKNFNLNCINESCYEKYLLNNKLLSLPNVIITPHIAYLTHEALLRIMETTVLNIDCCVKNNFNFCLKNQVLI